MKQLNFPEQFYSYDNSNQTYSYIRNNNSIIGLLELLWSAIENSPAELDKKEHKTNRSLKRKIREITKSKDLENDSRITCEGAQILLLEESELAILRRHLESNKFTSRVSDDIDALWEIIDTAKEYDVPKPQLIKS